MAAPAIAVVSPPPRPTSVPPTPTPKPPPPVPVAPPAPVAAIDEKTVPTKLRIPVLSVEAPIVALDVLPSGEMESPAGPDLVGWYTFSRPPGLGGNAVLSGHRDWYTGATGVFFRLSELRAGSAIEVAFGDRVLKYLVTESTLYAVRDIPVEKIVGQTSADVVTLITCEGAFDPANRDYSHRRIVRASLVDAASP